MGLMMKKLHQRSGLSDTALHLIGIVLIALAWTAAAALLRSVQQRPFPYPWEAAAALFRTVPGVPGAFSHLGASMWRWALGFSAAAAAGTLIGIVMALFPRFGEIVHPAVHTLQLIPGIAWIPVALLLFGLGSAAAIFMIAVTAAAPIIINTRLGILGIDRSLLRASAMMELGTLRTSQSSAASG